MRSWNPLDWSRFFASFSHIVATMALQVNVCQYCNSVSSDYDALVTADRALSTSFFTYSSSTFTLRLKSGSRSLSSTAFSSLSILRSASIRFNWRLVTSLIFSCKERAISRKSLLMALRWLSKRCTEPNSPVIRFLRRRSLPGPMAHSQRPM